MIKIIVTNSPFSELKNGTEIKRVEPKKKVFKNRGKVKVYTNDWFKIADGTKVLDRKDGCFRLFDNEFEVIDE